jgi:CDP-2,3-bis-(O-geranylgeranyl)-sn-glycerol synthase
MRLPGNANVDVLFGLLFCRDPRLLGLILAALWLMLPAYTANNCATLFGGGRPLDGGMRFFDGKRILGDHKTLGGFFFGVLGGVCMGIVQVFAAPYLSPFFSAPAIPAAVIVAMPLGALAGDAVKSFFKRRLGMESGAMLPVADQLDFIIGALVLSLVAAPAWFLASYTVTILVIIVLMTFPLQLFHNMVAVALGKKKVLW